MFGTSGIRGPVGDAVTADLALAVGRAVGGDVAAGAETGSGREQEENEDGPRVVVGRDPRDSGELLLDALAAGLRETGVDVVDLGLAATPTVARAVAWEDADAGVAITASHNPAPDNGIKLWQPSGQAYDADRRAEIERRVREEAYDLQAWDGLGRRRRADGDERHVRTLVDRVDPEPLDVVVDLGNGAGGVTVEALTRLGCSVETLNAQPDGSFPGRPSEPTAENCASLAALVRESDAQVGIAHDGDADRTRVVAADGTFVSGDATLALFAADAASAGGRRAGDADGEHREQSGGGRVAVPVDTSLAVEDYLADRGVGVERTPVGDVYVAEAATEPDVDFGGEPSGAWIWSAETLCPDGPYAACKLVELAGERPLAERLEEIPAYPIRRDSVAVDEKATVMERVVARVRDEYEDVSTLDGVRVDAGDGWFLLRASGTQPLIRVTAEARDADRAEELFADARAIIADAR